LRPLRTHLTLVTPVTLGPLNTLRTLRAGFTLNTLRTYLTGFTPNTLNTLRASFTLWAHNATLNSDFVNGVLNR
jgi:hypothetical protein